MVTLSSARVLCFSLLFFSCSSAPRFATTPPPGNPAGPHELEGLASFYADEFNGRKTANGEVFDMDDFTAAHRTLPFNTLLVVRNLNNGKEVTVRINDRGPFVQGRIIDLSFGAAEEINLVVTGTAPVVLDIIEMGPPNK